MDTRTVVVALLAALLAGAAVYALTDDQEDAETERLTAERDSLRQLYHQARRTLQVKDSTAAIEIREAQRTRARADTVWRASVDTLLAAIPDTLRPSLERMIRADSIEDAAYQREIDALQTKIAARDTVIARLTDQMEAQQALEDRLRERLDPSFADRLVPSIGEGAVKAGVVALGAATGNYEAAGGAALMWGVDAAF